MGSESSTRIGNMEGKATCREQSNREVAFPGRIQSRFLFPDFPSALFEKHSHTSISEFFRDVRMVGTLHLASAVSLASGRARRTRLRRNGNYFSAGHSQS